MASLKDTRRRINSVKNTQKITRAMKLVSAAKFARARERISGARSFSDALGDIVKRMAMAGELEGQPLAEKRDIKKVRLLSICSDRGLCGGLNANVIKVVQRETRRLKDLGYEVQFECWGNKVYSALEREGYKVESNHLRVTEAPSIEFVTAASERLIQEFISGKFEHLVVVFPAFISAISQDVRPEEVLPVSLESLCEGAEDSAEDLIIEPKGREMSARLLRRFVTNKLYRLVLEGSASEHGARMSAMDSATNNAGEVIRDLTLEYNRARQAAITKELIEITSGAEAL